MYTEIARPAITLTWTIVTWFLLCRTRPKLIQASDVLPNAKMIDFKNFINLFLVLSFMLLYDFYLVIFVDLVLQ